MHELLSEFFTRALAQVHHFEGTVNQFLGDGFMAIFGAPLADEDHAARAALAALAIREATTQFRGSGSLPGAERLHVRTGINSGQVVVGAIGDDLRMDYTAIGDTTKLAARNRPILLVECKYADADVSRGIRYLHTKYPEVPAGQVSGIGRKDYVTPGGVRIAPALELLKTLV